MAVRKPESRARARVLRELGWPLRRIANEVGASLSTVSLWVRDIQSSAAGPHPILAAGPDQEDEICVDLRRCGRCQRDLPLTSFNRHRSGHQWWCRDCFHAYFQVRAEGHRRGVRLARQIRRDRARAFASDYLQTHHCSDCGECDSDVLEFHHVQEKRRNVADMVRLGASVRALQHELDKCLVLCANCHRVRTAAARGSWRLDPESLDRADHLTLGERRNMTFLRDLLMKSRCVGCGDSRLVVLDFDHIGTKNGNVTDLARRGLSLQRLEAEVAQCVVRCANCHRRRTVGSSRLAS